MIDTVWIEPGYHSRESVKASEAAMRWGMTVKTGPNPETSRSVPVGGVEWCESWLEARPLPMFYPRWCDRIISRDIRMVNLSHEPLQYGRFIKSAERYKSFEAGILEYPQGSLLEDRFIWSSDVVRFTQEWRYYVADGTVLATGWYDGDNDDEPAPELPVSIPRGVFAAVDLGRLDDGRLELVECQHTYACGWYGDDHDSYLYWLMLGWEDVSRRHVLKKTVKTAPKRTGTHERSV